MGTSKFYIDAKKLSVLFTPKNLSRADLWPPNFVVHPTYDNPILRNVQAWTKRHAPPICTFLPDRLRDANDNAVNLAGFRSFSRILFENQMVSERLENRMHCLHHADLTLGCHRTLECAGSSPGRRHYNIPRSEFDCSFGRRDIYWHPVPRFRPVQSLDAHIAFFPCTGFQTLTKHGSDIHYLQ